ncbi:P-loop containing nucleoside triphosphate hydrolase protein [Neohortaea acidophila]|uniref:P-loop containing nucleoside triphosphate hydrolase protein n=1 Tax=Neohortaea acidophila TaxID=245834 RepID=A0A6A6PWD7_9PEZI|nr:P-loop containing nucleoside triphosphate hydrolase protein [Neohortaea acidophila]KAF2484488.1 P-loop containing nucleoside triphosphate hydrolase protein [Neohortaea acidophila]
MVALNPDESHNVEINPARGENDEPIYIPQKVAHAIKAHQLDGVRFLWREIACDGQEEGQGCILAHTMGLGKSMQTIALLAVLNHATKSKEPSIIRQLPFRLQKLANAEKRDKRNVRVLVICPPGLIPNWRREINDWTPGELGVVFSIEAGANGSELSTLKEWKRRGGVMLIGFQKFRNLLKKKANETADQAGDSEEFTDFERLLFKRPEIVVVDEAHQIKNTSAYVTELAGKIKTHHRIALTGTPMSNKVDEIYSLVSWVAPQFLGDPAEFRAHFTEPIKQGLFVDSTAYERRNSLKKLRVLHAEIGPKVNRANIEVLRGQLKGKIEYVIKVPLSEVQDKMYRGYIKALQAGNRSENASQVTIFAWLNNLTLLTNHPHLFRKMLLAPPAKKKKIKKGTDAEREQSPSTATESGSMPKFNSAETDAILDGWEDSLDSRFSAKLCVIMPLIDMSLDCGDNVLVFSTSLPTLDYLCELFRSKGRRYAHKRIDGSVKTADRMSALEQLNQGHIRIMLLSTKAAGVGLNMCSANRVIIVDSKFNPADEEQAIGRAYRIGQLKPVFVYRVFTGGSYDENLKALQIFKSSLTKRVVDKKNPRRDTERNARNYLYEPKEVEQEDLTKWIGKDPDVLDKLLQQHGSEEEGKHDTLIRSIDTMETLQEDAADAPLDEAEQKEVNDEIEMNKRRPRGRWAAAMEGLAPAAPPSTMPAPQRVGGGMASLQASAAFLRGLAPRMPSLGGLPSSTSG